MLSHALYDHADGMSTFFSGSMNHAKLYLRESCGENCYKKPDGKNQYISAYGKDFWKHMRAGLSVCPGHISSGTASGCFPTLRLQPGLEEAGNQGIHVPEGGEKSGSQTALTMSRALGLSFRKDW